MLHRCCVISVLLSSLIINVITDKPEMDSIRNVYATRNASDKFSQYQCYKYKYCKHGGGKVCGYDSDAAELATFEDLCTLYKANCRMGSRYFQVQMDICDVKTKFQAEYGDVFDWQPITRRPTNHTSTTTSRPIRDATVRIHGNKTLMDETMRANDTMRN